MSTSILYQDEHWIDQYGRRHRLDQMSKRYLRNALPFAKRVCHVEGMRLIMIMAGQFGPSGDMARDDFDRAFDRLMQYRVPLVEAMEKEIAERSALRDLWVRVRYGEMIQRLLFILRGRRSRRARGKTYWAGHPFQRKENR